jgi:aminopeptidase N
MILRRPSPTPTRTARWRHLDVFKRWYAQAGTPRLQARGRWDAEAGRYTLTLRQSNPPSTGQAHKPCRN